LLGIDFKLRRCSIFCAAAVSFNREGITETSKSLILYNL